jgi:hypothetical protein
MLLGITNDKALHQCWPLEAESSAALPVLSCTAAKAAPRSSRYRQP